jgi:hypothetical protein
MYNVESKEEIREGNFKAMNDIIKKYTNNKFEFELNKVYELYVYSNKTMEAKLIDVKYDRFVFEIQVGREAFRPIISLSIHDFIYGIEHINDFENNWLPREIYILNLYNPIKATEKLAKEIKELADETVKRSQNWKDFSFPLFDNFVKETRNEELKKAEKEAKEDLLIQMQSQYLKKTKKPTFTGNRLLDNPLDVFNLELEQCDIPKSLKAALMTNKIYESDINLNIEYKIKGNIDGYDLNNYTFKLDSYNKTLQTIKFVSKASQSKLSLELSLNNIKNKKFIITEVKEEREKEKVKNPIYDWIPNDNKELTKEELREYFDLL